MYLDVLCRYLGIYILEFKDVWFVVVFFNNEDVMIKYIWKMWFIWKVFLFVMINIFFNVRKNRII